MKNFFEKQEVFNAFLNLEGEHPKTGNSVGDWSEFVIANPNLWSQDFDYADEEMRWTLYRELENLYKEWAA